MIFIPLYGNIKANVYCIYQPGNANYDKFYSYEYKNLRMLCQYLLTRTVYILLINHNYAVTHTLKYEKLPSIITHAY